MKSKNEHNFILVNADTDSISICKANCDPFTEEEQLQLLSEINEISPPKIHWEHDGLYSHMLVVKAKNYAYMDGDKLKVKGSALLANYKEPALKEFLELSIKGLMFGECPSVLYNKVAKKINAGHIKIDDWCSKKTVTEKVLSPERTQEEKILNAIKEAGKHVGLGDKIYTYFREDGTVALLESYNNDHCPRKLLEKLFKTAKVLESVVKITDFPNYSLKSKRHLLDHP